MRTIVATCALRTLLTTAGGLFLLAGMSRGARAGIPTPEIDAGSLASGVALLAGGVLLITGVCRKRVESSDCD